MIRLWRTGVLFLVALWFGGFTFYAGFVVPIGSEVLGSDRLQGFVTRDVTVSLNWIGVCALCALWIDFARFGRLRSMRRLACVTLLVATLLQLSLFVMHPWLDALLEPGTKAVDEAPMFYGRHRFYLLASGVQWVATLVHLFSVVHVADAHGTSYDAHVQGRGRASG